MFDRWRFWLHTIINSYAQLFFSLDQFLGILLIVVTLLDPFLGLSALAMVIWVNVLAKIVGFSEANIYEGVYGFNAVLLGLVLAFEYQFNTAFVSLVLLGGMLLLGTQSALQVFFAKYRLPVLALPFFLTYAAVYLAAGNFSTIVYQEDYIFTDNYQLLKSQRWGHQLSYLLNDWDLPILMNAYFRTLSATFFQNSVLAGMLISLAILRFSRIAFSLTLISFFVAYYWFSWLGVDVTMLTHYLMGSNFLFFALSVGCFFIIPGRGSYLAVIALTPILVVLMIALQKVCFVFQLKSFTLAFSVLTITLLLVLQHRVVAKYLKFPNIQYYNPEKTVYKTVIQEDRLKYGHLAKFQLPFWGAWKVSQGHKGSITHLDDWAFALDFCIEDDAGNTYQSDGIDAKDYYCYAKPVLAPDAGYVYDIISHVEENAIGEVNISQNWGNTVLINHQNGLFSQLSHLHKDTIKVQIGSYVTKGSIIGYCGNSGRSPEPHLHFQIQTQAYIGAPTYYYSIAYFFSITDNQIKSFTVPREGEWVRNIETSADVIQAYTLLPGKRCKVHLQNSNEQWIWEVKTDAFNRTYLYCMTTESQLWFHNDGVYFYAYDFEGDFNAALYEFYLSNYRVLLSISEVFETQDKIPLSDARPHFLRWIHDFFAPIFSWAKIRYTSFPIRKSNEMGQDLFQISAKVNWYYFNWNAKQLQTTTIVSQNHIRSFVITNKSKQKVYLCDWYVVSLT